MSERVKVRAHERRSPFEKMSSLMLRKGDKVMEKALKDSKLTLYSIVAKDKYTKKNTTIQTIDGLIQYYAARSPAQAKVYALIDLKTMGNDERFFIKSAHKKKRLGKKMG